jgi:hypothetical protein
VSTGIIEPPQFYRLTDGGEHLDFFPHTGQRRALESSKRFILVLAGSQSGKTCLGPPWLWDEIATRGPGDYLCVAPSYPLMQKKVLPEFLRLFETLTRRGEYKSGERTFHFHDEQTKVFFGHADDPESLESATAKAAWLDEAGQKRFRFGSWEAIVRRLAIHRGRVLITTTPYCYDEATEIYTRRGWQSFGSLTSDDEVLACTPDGDAHFEKPRGVVWQEYTGPMIRLTGGRVDLLVTPNHRIAYRNSTRFYTSAAAEFVRKAYRSLVIPKTVRVHDNFPDVFHLPAVKRGHRWGNNVRAAAAELPIPMKAWCAFMGWFLSEGSVRGCKGGRVHRHSYRVTICQNEGPKRDRMRVDLKCLPFNWSEDKVGFHAADKQLWSYLSRLGSSGQKYIPEEVKRASPGDLAVLIDRMILGDGTYRKEREGEFVYYTTSPRLADDFREVCMLAGVSTHASLRSNHGGQIRGRPLVATRQIIHVSQRKRRGAIVQSHEQIEYSGHIGCVSVSTGYVLVRRNGEECICGNTLGWMKQQLYDKWKAGDPEIDVINFDSTANPTFPKEEYERARVTMPRWRFDMFYRGLFVKPAGMIYDAFDDGLNVCPRFAIPADWPRYLGLDFGGVNTAGVFIAEEPHSRPPRYYAYREYLAGGRTVKGHADAFVQSEPCRPRLVVGGSKSEGQWRDEFAACGLPVLEPEISDVEVGIDRVYGAVAERCLVVFSDLDGLLDEFGSYSRVMDDAGETTEKIADKENYHRLDAVRYIVGWLRRGMADGVPTSTAPPGRPSFRSLGRPTFGNRPTFRGR